MLRELPRRGAAAALAVLLLGLCTATNDAAGQPMRDGADEMGLVGSARHQTNVVPAQRNQFIRDQVVASENGPTMALHAQAKIKRETPAKQEAAPAAAPSAPVAAGPQQTGAGKSEGGPSSTASLGDKLKEHANKVGQAIAGYSDQLAAQIPKRLRRQAPQIGASYGQQQNPLEAASASLAALVGTARNQASSAIQQYQNFRDQLVGSVAPVIDQTVPRRLRRQVTYASGSESSGANGGSSSSSSPSGIMKYLSDLGQQANQAQAISQFLSAAGASGSHDAAGQPAGGFELAKVMSQLTDMIRSLHERNGRVLETSRKSVEAAGQQAAEVAKTAQGSAQSALGELSQGLQRLASNNPNLLPDIKNLYQTIASRLSSATAAATQSVQGNQQQLNLPVTQ